jgi:hypothetical protein
MLNAQARGNARCGYLRDRTPERPAVLSSQRIGSDDKHKREVLMKLLLFAGFLSLSMGAATIAHADNCDTKLTTQERAIWASLTPEDQQTLAKMKMKDGSLATCEFRAGLLDMLGNHAPKDRSEAFHYLLKNTLAKQD